jgi:excisionase family DNA binding protein
MALQPTEPERMTITVEETALQLGIGRNLAYDLARRGKLPGAIRLGRRILVSKKALESFLAGQSGVSK